MLQKVKRSLIIAWLATLFGCQFYSSVEPPKPAVNGEYLTKVEFCSAGQKGSFFQSFHDHTLIELIQTAIKNNQDLQVALERIQEAEDFYGVVRSKDFPQVGLDLDAQRTRSSKSGFSEVQGTPFAIGVGSNRSVVTNIFLQAFNLSWEIDFFGRIRNQKKRAAFMIEEVKAYQRGVQLTLVADVAITYFAVNAYRELIELTKESILNLQQLVTLRSSGFSSGLESTQKVLDVEKQVFELKQTLFELEKSYGVFFNHLAQLVGEEPSLFKLDKNRFQPVSSQVFLQVSLPASLLKNRPDLLVAQNQLIQAGYSVKVAEADLFPTVSLLGAFGYASGLATNWFTKANSFWSVGPTVRWPVFQGFQYWNQLKVEKSRQRQAALHYQSTLLKALEDVENTLVTFFNQEKIALDAKNAYETQEKIYRANTNLTVVGLRSEEFTLVQENERIEQKKRMIVEQFKTCQALVQLYKALGGEWK
jgi:NodT family efflux transporter outer membrane factor (OMF) lipoprotein